MPYATIVDRQFIKIEADSVWNRDAEKAVVGLRGVFCHRYWVK